MLRAQGDGILFLHYSHVIDRHFTKRNVRCPTRTSLTSNRVGIWLAHCAAPAHANTPACATGTCRPNAWKIAGCWRSPTVELSTLLPANGAGLGESDPSMILWQGQQRAVNPGHWIVAMDGLPATPSLQQTVGAQLLQQHASGPALKVLGSLGGQGSLLVETAPNVSYAEVKTSLSGLPGFRYVEPDFLISLNTHHTQ